MTKNLKKRTISTKIKDEKAIMSAISPRVDLAFKKIFGVEENKDLLISLINSIVSEEDQVSDVILLNPYNAKNFAKDKLSILDIKAKSATDGKMFNIEIQISDEADYDKRALYYWAKLYTEQLQASADYSELAKAIGIHILNFTSIPKAEKYHNVFKIIEKESHLEYFENLELHTIELSKFTNTVGNELSGMVKKIQNALDRWVAFLTRHDLLDVEHLPSELEDSHLKKALQVLNVINFNDEEREAYESHLKWFRIEASTVKKYEAKGRAEGRVEGRTEGLAEGRIEIASKMKLKGLNSKTIAELTGLGEDEIEKL